MALNVSLWTKVGIAVQSALAAAVTIGPGGITKANPGVATYVGADPSNGDYMIVTAQGMYQVDGRVFRGANVSGGGNTIELEGENTTGYDTITSGTLEVVTFGTTLATATNINASGGDFSFVDTTTIHDDRDTQVPGNSTPAVYTFENIWDVADAGLIALKQASDNKARRAFKFTFANGQKLVFVGYVGCTLLPTGSAKDKVTTQTVITMFGRPTVYAS